MSHAASPTASHEVDPATLKKAIGASAIGNATEWYDYGVFAYVATYIGAQFFPGDYATLSTLLVYAVSFVLRPLGGLVWGPIGDRIGRRRVLATTIILMTISTVLVGLLPGYGTIGVLAPILLVLLRVVQGFSTGGEYGGAATFMAEYAPDKRRGFFGSFLEVGTLAGFSLAVGIVTLLEVLLSDAQMADWGWRLPFFVALPLGLVGMYIRSKMEDTPVFRELEERGQSQEAATGALREMFTRYWKPFLIMFGMVITLNVTNYTLLAYMPTYLQEYSDLSSVDLNLLVLVGQILMMLTLPFVGGLSDKVGRKPLWLGSIVALFVLAIPMYKLLPQNFVVGALGFLVLGLAYVPQLATISATFPAMFPSHVRYAGMAASYNISTAIFGGTALSVIDFFIKKTGDDLFPAYYMMGACVFGFLATLMLTETAGHSVRGREVPGSDEAKKAQASA